MAIETDFNKEFENFRKICIELEEKSKKDEMKCLKLETEVENLKNKNQELEGKIGMIKEVLVYSTYGKRKAEAEVCFWKEKVNELESKIDGVNEKVKEDGNVVLKGAKEDFYSRVRKRLLFEEDGCINKKMAPSTPGVAQSPIRGVIDVSDEDVNYNEMPKVKKVYGLRKCCDLTKSQCSFENDLQKTNLEDTDEENVDEFRVCLSNSRSAKRRRAANIIASDDEDSYDDSVSICRRKRQHRSWVSTDSEVEVKENVGRSYLTRLRKAGSKNKQDKRSLDLNKTVGSREDEEDNDGVDESESEGESLGGFIVDGSKSVYGCDSESSNSTDESEDVFNEYKATLEKIGRKKIPNLKWGLEGDMLADFGKDPALCMSAVCALYRKQTADEKASKVTRYHNERGFSQTDAWRASKLAEFLTDGDSDGDLNKTVKELKVYNSKGIELCRTLAIKYSKQLFQIYQNKEDPYFPPQR